MVYNGIIRLLVICSIVDIISSYQKHIRITQKADSLMVDVLIPHQEQNIVLQPHDYFEFDVPFYGGVLRHDGITWSGKMNRKNWEQMKYNFDDKYMSTKNVEKFVNEYIEKGVIVNLKRGTSVIMSAIECDKYICFKDVGYAHFPRKVFEITGIFPRKRIIFDISHFALIGASFVFVDDSDGEHTMRYLKDDAWHFGPLEFIYPTQSVENKVNSMVDKGHEAVLDVTGVEWETIMNEESGRWETKRKHFKVHIKNDKQSAHVSSALNDYRNYYLTGYKAGMKAAKRKSKLLYAYD